MLGTNPHETDSGLRTSNDSDAGVSTETQTFRAGTTRDPGHDRQVLVIGGDIAALATAGFLDHAGLDPVLAVEEHHVPDSTVVSIWRPGLELLERIGMRRPVEAVSTPLNELRRVGSFRTPPGTSSSRPRLVAVRHDRFKSLFDGHVSSQIRTIDESVRSIESTDEGVYVVFEHGLTEGFDTVVTSDLAVIPCRRPENWSQIHYWAFDWPSSVHEPHIPTEAWARDSAAVTVPAGDSVRARLVSRNDVATGSPLATDRLSEQFRSVFGVFGDAISDLDESALQYRRIPFAVPNTLSIDNIVLVGPGVRASIPGDLLGSALSIEDGWVLSDALTYGPPSVERAISEYETRRQRRAAAISSTARSDPFLEDAPENLSGVIQQLWARRSIAFGHLFNRNTSEITDVVPDRL